MFHPGTVSRDEAESCCTRFPNSNECKNLLRVQVARILHKDKAEQEMGPGTKRGFGGAQADYLRTLPTLKKNRLCAMALTVATPKEFHKQPARTRKRAA